MNEDENKEENIDDGETVLGWNEEEDEERIAKRNKPWNGF